MCAKKSTRALFALVLLLLGFPRVGRPQSNGLQKLFSDYYEFLLRENPTLATFAGRAEYNDRWDDPLRNTSGNILPHSSNSFSGSAAFRKLGCPRAIA